MDYRENLVGEVKVIYFKSLEEEFSIKNDFFRV